MAVGRPVDSSVCKLHPAGCANVKPNPVTCLIINISPEGIVYRPDNMIIRPDELLFRLGELFIFQTI